MFDLDGALKMFDSVLVSSSAGQMIPTVLAATGDIYIAQNKLNDATKKFSTIVSSSYSNQEQRTAAQFRLAEIQFFSNNFDSVLALLTPLTENLKIDESNDALLLQYFVSENKFQFPEALKQYSHAELLARQYKVGEAIQELSSIIDIYPTAPLADDALLKKAEYSIQLKRYTDALAAYEKLLADYKESIEKDKTQFKIGELYQFYLLDKQKAIAAYEVILEKYPFSLFTEQARKRIRQIRGDSI
jgi:tetratricopeptide (TPR) repeat protein